MSIIVNGEIDNPYQTFIQRSRYSRWLESENRRETWVEIVDRYVDFMSNTEHGRRLPAEFWGEAHEAILNLDVMPSMRALMTAGPALERENLAQFNCSFVAADDPRAWDEALYILMNGVGLGFSVERRHTMKLPVVPENFRNTTYKITVEDSKEGWATAFRDLIGCLYKGELPQINITKIRPAGERLKTFGGRASGPQPLIDLFSFVIGIFDEARGRQLTPFEVHRIFCKIGEVVVVGGVRRSALISLSDLDDKEMATAKSGEWWKKYPELGLANNSAVYPDEPSRYDFSVEWQNLVDSGSGERGIFNLGAAVRGSNFRRDWLQVEGTNPCGEILLRSKGLCNLTEIVVKDTDDLISLQRKTRIATVLGTVQSSLTDFGYLRPEWKQNAEEERLLGVSMTGQFGHKVMSGSEGLDVLAEWLDSLREYSVQVNKAAAERIGITQSVCVTTVKPSGTVSQLTASSSGMHPWHSKHYVRSVRGDNKDPLTNFLKSVGIPSEPEKNKPNDTTVFYFPQSAPEGAVTRKDISAIDHLEVWKVYKEHWTEHNPSITVSVKADEWTETGNWVYENWKSVGGLSFLPYSDHTYDQAPYQEYEADDTVEFYFSSTGKTFTEFEATMPDIDWSFLEYFETEDTTSGSQTLSCAAGNCELVDI